MTVQDLIDILEAMPRDAEVRLAFQPTWPLQFHCGDVVESTNCRDCDADDDGVLQTECHQCDGSGGTQGGPDCSWCRGTGMEECDHKNADDFVFIGEGGSVSDDPYLPANASTELGWR